MLNIQVQPISASLIRDTEVLGEMDPYVICTFMGKVSRSKTHLKGGKEPLWNDNFLYTAKGLKEFVKVEVWDEDMLKDDLIGTGFLNLMEAVNNQKKGINVHKVRIEYNNQVSGVVKFKVLVTNFPTNRLPPDGDKDLRKLEKEIGPILAN